MKTFIPICFKTTLILFASTLSLFAQNVKYVKVTGSGFHDGSNWENALSNEEFQLALQRASTGTSFFLASGIYYVYPDKSEKSTFLIPPGVKILGGYAENAIGRDWTLYKTILSGDIGLRQDSIDNVLNTVTFASPVQESLLEGVTVEGALVANVSGCTGGICEMSLPIKNVYISPTFGVSSKQENIHANNEALSQAFSLTKCGLNYTTISKKLAKRYNLNGFTQPTAFDIALPSTAKIERVFIWADASGNGALQKVSLTTPDGYLYTQKMKLVGSAADKCWSYSGSYTYRADITPYIKGTGTYFVSGLSTGSENDIDGATIFVLYTDSTATYQGTITIDDGAVVGIGSYREHIQSIPTACGVTSNAKVFMGIGDLQNNGTTVIKLNNAIASHSANIWNFIEKTTTISTTQKTNNFSVSATRDCYNIAFVGMYYQTVSCMSCQIVLEQYHSISTKPKFNNKQLISDSKKGLKVCADGTSVTIFKVSGLGNSIALRMMEDPNATDANRYGKFLSKQTIPNGVEFTYQHPTSITSAGAWITFNIELYNTTNTTVLATFSLDVYRTPVITVHGLWSVGSSFNALQTYLTSSNHALYTADLVHNANYSPTNDAFFANNSQVVPNKIDEVIKNLREKGYGVGKCDLVGHSMGGILSRLYLQSARYENDIYRIITINTPHAGSQVANLLSDPNFEKRRNAICSLLSNLDMSGNKNASCDNGAINDLRVNSIAILQDLNGSGRNNHIVPSHAIVTFQEFQPIVIPSNSRNQRPRLQAIYESVIQTSIDTLFNFEENDLIVPESSQRGGLVGCTSTIDNQIHMGAQSNINVMERIQELLISSPSGGNFCTSGFNPPRLTYNVSAPSISEINPSATASVAINLPIDGRSVTDNQTLDFNISSSNISEMFVLIDYNTIETIVYRTQNNILNFTEIINLTFDTGEHDILVIGKKSDGSMITAIKTFKVNRCQTTLGPLSGLLDEPLYQVYQTITTNGAVSIGQEVSLIAEKSVDLLPGFRTENNAVFKVNIENCTN
ncbi:3-coathanger stack domain-containing protein [Emticicia sp. BO119]|uniref:lipase family alpha/beta hydrolase n=1 Tax=Emticicia sp. BO119 TaxID=2757768 RepID=UPI0015F0314D|nr:3-coathanger stack domain-containing protein [Emticicia sp. BO119]MBA4850471.1 alpha/beta hydrolase [Emticicia sp. BO119]